jgi:hypothetical protein
MSQIPRSFESSSWTAIAAECMGVRELNPGFKPWPAVALGLAALLGCASQSGGGPLDTTIEAGRPAASSTSRQSVTSADGAVWHLQPSAHDPALFDIYRDNVQVSGSAYEIQAFKGNVRVKGEDDKWWYWSGGFWSPTPIEASREVREDASKPPSRDPVTASDGMVWSLKPIQTKPGLYEVYRDNVQITGHAREIQAVDGNIRVKGEDRAWWYWTGTYWSPTPPDPALRRLQSSPEGSKPPVTAGNGSIWTLKPSMVKPGFFEVYRDQVQVPGFVHALEPIDGNVRVKGEDNNWWYWTGDSWSQTVPTEPPVGPSAEPPPPPQPVLTMASASHIALSPTEFLVKTGPEFQVALNAAKPGDTIYLDPAGSFVGSFIAPLKDEKATAYITIRPSTPDRDLPPAGTRMTPEAASRLPLVISNSAGHGLVFPTRSHHWKIKALAFTQNVAIAEDVISVWVMPEYGTIYTTADQPHHIEIDQVYVHTGDGQWTKRGIAANGAHISITNSWIDNIKYRGADSQAVVAWTASGPITVINNYLEAAGENVMFGGGHSLFGAEGTPADITIRQNHLFKPLKWWREHPSWDGSRWTVKNLLELKMAKRVVVENNILENCWPHAQIGYGIVLSPTNDINLDPWATVEDVTIRNNVIKNVTIGVAFTRPGPHPTLPVSRVSVLNNVFTGNTSGLKCPNPWVENGPPTDCTENQSEVFIVGSPHTLSIRQNTFVFGNPKKVGYVEGRVAKLTLSNNIFAAGMQDGIQGYSVSSGEAAMRTYFSDGIVQNNAFVGLAGSARSLSDQIYVRDLANAKFADPAKGNYRLLPSSPLAGRNVGVDWAAWDQSWTDHAAPSALNGPPASDRRTVLP